MTPDIDILTDPQSLIIYESVSFVALMLQAAIAIYISRNVVDRLPASIVRRAL